MGRHWHFVSKALPDLRVLREMGPRGPRRGRACARPGVGSSRRPADPGLGRGWSGQATGDRAGLGSRGTGVGPGGKVGNERGVQRALVTGSVAPVPRRRGVGVRAGAVSERLRRSRGTQSLPPPLWPAVPSRRPESPHPAAPNPSDRRSDRGAPPRGQSARDRARPAARDEAHAGSRSHALTRPPLRPL